jgi:hypothetical protein
MRCARHRVGLGRRTLPCADRCSRRGAGDRTLRARTGGRRQARCHAHAAPFLFLTITADEARLWRVATEPVIGRWFAQMKQRGRDGGKLLDAARELVAASETT